MKTEKLIEGVDYELIPNTESGNEQAWSIRVLTGDFVETVIQFGNIAFDGDSGCINFNFMVVSSPSGSTEDDVDLQEHAGLILENILEEAAQNGSLVTNDRNTEDESED